MARIFAVRIALFFASARGRLYAPRYGRLYLFCLGKLLRRQYAGSLGERDACIDISYVIAVRFARILADTSSRPFSSRLHEFLGCVYFIPRHQIILFCEREACTNMVDIIAICLARVLIFTVSQFGDGKLDGIRRCLGECPVRDYRRRYKQAESQNTRGEKCSFHIVSQTDWFEPS